VKKCAGYTGGDGDKLTLPEEDLYLAGAGKFRQIYGASAADVRSRHFVGCDTRKRRKQSTGMDDVGIQEF
jgi:hypothetical protein